MLNQRRLRCLYPQPPPNKGHLHHDEPRSSAEPLALQ
ncbi:Uncharacterised protein [Vibrio cholerae]|nr:Uncharacterised protein [Vibrio cholerae]